MDWSVPRRLLRTQANKRHHLTALRAVWQGAFFTTTRAARRHCPLCGCAADLQHVLLDCRWWTGRGKPPPPHWDKQRRTWPAQSLWVRALPPASYTEPPLWPASATELKHTGCWAAGEPIDTADLLFATDATGTTKDPRTRVVAAAVIACRWAKPGAVLPFQRPPTPTSGKKCGRTGTGCSAPGTRRTGLPRSTYEDTAALRTGELPSTSSQIKRASKLPQLFLGSGMLPRSRNSTSLWKRLRIFLPLELGPFSGGKRHHR